MQKISRIMCVVDPDAEAQPALQRGAWLAGHLGAELELLICYYNEYLSDGRLEEYSALGSAHEDILDGLKMQLESMARPLRNSGLVVHTKSAWDHPRYEGIIRSAVESGADIVLKDTHHHSAISRVLLTNTDWHLIRSCPVPLWLVKPQDIAEKYQLRCNAWTREATVGVRAVVLKSARGEWRRIPTQARVSIAQPSKRRVVGECDRDMRRVRTCGQ